MRGSHRSDPWLPRGGEPLLVRVALAACAKMRVPLERFGLDVPILSELLRVNLLRLLRRDGSSLGGSFPGLMPLVISFSALGFFMTGLMGGVMALVEPDVRLWLGVTQGLHMGFLVFLVLGQYVQFLVDATDIEVLGARPVPDRTLFAARILMLLGMLLFFSSFTILGTLITAPFGLSAWRVILLFPLVTILHSILALGLVGLGVSSLLRLVGPRRFQVMLLWVQVFALGFLFSGGALVSALASLVPFEALGRHLDSLGYLPPLEAFGAWRLLSGTVSFATILQTLSLVLFPAAALWMTLRLAERHFLDGIRGELTLGRVDARDWRPTRTARILRRLLRSPQDRASAELAAAYGWREPMFVRAVIPQLFLFGGIVPVLGKDIPPSLLIGIVSGIVLFLVMIVLAGSQASRESEARWVYAQSPEPDPARFLRAGVLGVFASVFVLPTALLTVALALWLGWAQVPVLLLAGELVCLVTLLLLPRWSLSVPFTEPLSPEQQMNTRNLAVVFATLGAGFLVTGLVPLLAWNPVVLTVTLLGLPLALPWAWRGARGWELDSLARASLGWIEPKPVAGGGAVADRP